MALLFKSYYRKAEKHYKLREWDAALRAIQGALHILPTAKDAVLFEVKVLKEMEHFEEASDVLQQALKYHPYWSTAILELADLKVNRLQQADKAWRWLQRLKLCRGLTQTEMVRWCSLKVASLLEQERLYEASRCLRDALRLYPNDKDLLFLQGWIELQRDNYYAAASSLNRVLKQYPDHSDAHYYLGWAFRGLGEFRLVQAHYRKTYELDLDDRSPLRYESKAFRNMALQALSQCGQTHDCASVRLVICATPTASILEDFPYDPRRMGTFFRHAQAPRQTSEQYLPPMGTLYLFQRNIERLCLTERDVHDELIHIINREIASVSFHAESPEFHISLPDVASVGQNS